VVDFRETAAEGVIIHWGKPKKDSSREKDRGKKKTVEEGRESKKETAATRRRAQEGQLLLRSPAHRLRVRTGGGRVGRCDSWTGPVEVLVLRKAARQRNSGSPPKKVHASGSKRRSSARKAPEPGLPVKFFLGGAITTARGGPVKRNHKKARGPRRGVRSPSAADAMDGKHANTRKDRQATDLPGGGTRVKRRWKKGMSEPNDG